MDLQRIGHRIETRDRKPKTVLEIQAADLAVGDDVETDRLLQLDELANASELDSEKRPKRVFDHRGVVAPPASDGP